ncbi:cytochrome c [Bizionia echini]|uniref:Cytochrome c n=1 Tax=Bizionia echini TaxID=649333 RepID=A0A1I5AWR3_9FLAO|nr:c-type cytochrome [Bizionia echini]SFN66821.1 cytochrome c [Bizionia echini]
MRIISLLLLILVWHSCKSDKKVEESINNAVPKRAELSYDSKIFLGNRLFSEKTCVTCHAIETYYKAPSVIEIMKVYKENNADIVSFLKGNSKPILNVSANEVAIMQNNIDGFLKKITDEELNAIATYMMHVDELVKNK